MIVQVKTAYSQYCDVPEADAGQLPERAFNGAILQREHQGLQGRRLVTSAPLGSRPENLNPADRNSDGQVLSRSSSAISIALVLGTAVVVTYF